MKRVDKYQDGVVVGIFEIFVRGVSEYSHDQWLRILRSLQWRTKQPQTSQLAHGKPSREIALPIVKMPPFSRNSYRTFSVHKHCKFCLHCHGRQERIPSFPKAPSSLNLRLLSQLFLSNQDAASLAPEHQPPRCQAPPGSLSWCPYISHQDLFPK